MARAGRVLAGPAVAAGAGARVEPCCDQRQLRRVAVEVARGDAHGQLAEGAVDVVRRSSAVAHAACAADGVLLGFE